MHRIEEILYDRLGTAARRTGKQYAILERGAWGERSLIPFKGDNSVEFTGRLVTGGNWPADDAPIVKIGFYHPLFNGYAGKWSAVEVVDNLSTGNKVRYSARGRGALSLTANCFCADVGKVVDPCEFIECDACVWGLTVPAELGTDASFALYDVETMKHPIGVNEIPARTKLRGYDGPRKLPAPNLHAIFNWSPGVGAFDLTFQRCGTLQPGIGGPWHPDCCAILDTWKEDYGAEWFNTVADMMESGELTPFDQYPWTDCNWIFAYAVSLAIKG